MSENGKIPPSFGLAQVAGIYEELERELRLLPDAMLAPSRDHKFLGNFVSGFIGHDADWHDLDFSRVPDSGKVKEIDFLKADTAGLLKSICIIRDRKDRLFADVLINRPALNECWYRFCYVKEICQAVIREDYRNRDFTDFYPKTSSYEETIYLFSNLIRNPFSFGDFDAADDSYPLELKIENAAEVLAAALMLDLDQLFEEKQKVKKSGGRLALEEYDFRAFAAKWKLPERYVFLFMTADEAEVFYDFVVSARNGLPID